MASKPRMASGEMTLEASTVFPTITHNLGTTSVLVVAQRVNSDHSHIDSSNRYKSIFVIGATVGAMGIDEQQTYSYNGGNQVSFNEEGQGEGSFPFGIYSYFTTATGSNPANAVMSTKSWISNNDMIDPISSNEVKIMPRYQCLDGRWVWRVYALG